MYRADMKTAKNGNFCEKLPSGNDFEAVLASFCFYEHGGKPSEAVQKIATGQKEDHKCSLYVIISWKAKMYQSVINCETWLVPRTPLTQAKEAAEFSQKK